jgi:uncharacterized protein (DUF1697 family)
VNVPTYVGLLRGINVGGNKMVPMAELRALFEALGCTEVRTYIQSGNVVFASPAPLATKQVEAAIVDRFAFDVTVMLRSAAAIKKVVKANPFPRVDQSKLHVGFMSRKPLAAAVASLDADRFLPEQFVVHGTELYVHLPNGLGNTKLLAYLDRQLRIPITVRNWNTVTKLVELAR